MALAEELDTRKETIQQLGSELKEKHIENTHLQNKNKTLESKVLCLEKRINELPLEPNYHLSTDEGELKKAKVSTGLSCLFTKSPKNSHNKKSNSSISPAQDKSFGTSIK
jgi:hypothetical protein